MNTLDLQKLTINSLEDLKGQDIVALDVADRTSVTDWMIVVTGTSARHVKSLANEVVEKSKEAGVRPLGVEGEEDGNWILVDLGDVLTHVMTRESRDFYALEKLWAVEETTDEETSDEKPTSDDSESQGDQAAV